MLSMSLGSRIAGRLAKLGLTQAELARRSGAPQTTVNSLIKGNSRSTPHLVRIARALETTPAYLTGETDDDSIDAVDLAYSPQDREWIDLLHDLDRVSREAVLQLARTLRGGRRARASEDDPAIPVLQDKVLAYRGQE